MMPPKCYTWLESCGSQLSDGKNEKLFFCILQSVGFSRTLRTDIFLYTEKLSYVVLHRWWKSGLSDLRLVSPLSVPGDGDYGDYDDYGDGGHKYADHGD